MPFLLFSVWSVLHRFFSILNTEEVYVKQELPNLRKHPELIPLVVPSIAHQSAHRWYEPGASCKSADGASRVMHHAFISRPRAEDEHLVVGRHNKAGADGLEADLCRCYCKEPCAFCCGSTSRGNPVRGIASTTGAEFPWRTIESPLRILTETAHWRAVCRGAANAVLEPVREPWARILSVTFTA